MLAEVAYYAFLVLLIGGISAYALAWARLLIKARRANTSRYNL